MAGVWRDVTLLVRLTLLVALALLALAVPATAADTLKPTAVLGAPATVGIFDGIPLTGGSSSDAGGGTIVEYRWTVGSRAVVSTGASTFSAPGFTTPGRVRVELVVVDDSGNVSAPDSRDVIVRDDLAPTAVIDGPDTVATTAPIPLQGGRSFDTGGEIAEYRWTLSGRTAVVTPDPSFSAPGYTTAQNVQATLVVVDDAGNVSQPIARTVRVTANQAPTAVLGAPPTVAIGASIPLAGGSSTDPEGAIVSYRWNVGSRPVVVTQDPTFSAPGFATPGVQTVSLVVVDDAGNQSAPASRSVVVRDESAPTAVLDAPGVVGAGAPLALSGSRSSDVGGSVREYRWTVADRAPVTTPDATFAAPGLSAPGSYAVRLVVVDDAGNVSAPDQRTVVVRDEVAPTAVLSAPEAAGTGTPLVLGASQSSDSGGRIVGYRWTVAGRAPVETADPAFTAPGVAAPGRIAVTLVVTDDAGNESAPDRREIVVRDDARPTAVLDAPATVQALSPIALSAARSSDVGGRIVKYRWTVGGRAPVETPDAAFSAPGFPSAQTVTVRLVVVDDAGNESPSVSRTVTVVVTGTKVTTFKGVRLLAPSGERRSQIDLGARTLLAGRVSAPQATRVTAVFSIARPGGRRLTLGRTTVDVDARGVARLGVPLTPQGRAALRGRRTAAVRMVVTTRSLTAGPTTTTRTVVFAVSG